MPLCVEKYGRKKMSAEKKFTPSKKDGGLRLDAFLGRELTGYVSREKIKKAIIQGKVRLNAQPCTRPKTPVEYADSIEIDLDSLRAESKTPVAENLPLEILYQDADVAIINKAAGLTIHPCPSCPDGTLVNRLIAHFPELLCQGADKKNEINAPDFNGLPNVNAAPDFQSFQGFDDEPENLQVAQQGDRPGIVHRLDKDTTGLLLIALNEASRLKLATAFAAREVKKEYLALVYGVPDPAQGNINVPIGRDAANKTRMAAMGIDRNSNIRQSVRPNIWSDINPAMRLNSSNGREALSEYRTLYADPAGRFSLLAVRIHTGRTHQVRVHLRHLGHPILGDALYFDSRAASLEMQGFVEHCAPRPLLHAWKLAFRHPLIQEAHNQEIPENMDFCCPPPTDFYSAALALSQLTPQVVLTGNAGCGKSSVLSLLVKEAAPAGFSGVSVWNADKAVAALYEQGGDGWLMLRSAYGARFVPDEQAGVDKKALFGAMFEDASLRREIEGLIHPLVLEAKTKFFQKHDFWNNLRALSTLPALSALPELVAAEVPLYFEASAGLRKNKPKTGATEPIIIGVHCPQTIRAERLKINRGWPDSMIAKMESWQWDENKKMQACDLVLDNSGPPEQLEAEVKKILGKLKDFYTQRLENIQKNLEELIDRTL
jgi:23S rRNA pseudouridine1911/1915/1917 synthase